MEVKLFELRDRGTFIPVIAIRCVPDNEIERKLLSRAGYGQYPEHQSEYILFGRADGKSALTYDPFVWNDRTFSTAHRYITQYWFKINSGDLIDVEYLLGETDHPCESELYAY